ncbi:MAG: 3-hydroxyacyl-CoA dehydrogenase NAD-binding domain-containing protein [Ferruginibacter sp.]
MVNSICVAGGGTMGAGIALVAAQNGFPTMLFDLDKRVIEKAIIATQNSIRQLTGKQKITAVDGTHILNRIHFTSDISTCVADLVIEAIIENKTAKTDLFKQLAFLNSPSAIFATNTSSLSVSAIQAAIDHPERVVGMHFFNPAMVMKLIEVVKGKQTSDGTTHTIVELCKLLGKIPVVCNDSPGFIVNRIARHYYLEAMNLVEAGLATMEEADMLMEASGFKMGPFKLMDLIGLDVNLAVSQSIYESLGRQARFAPSTIQESKVASGELGRKTGKGFYNYTS